MRVFDDHARVDIGRRHAVQTGAGRVAARVPHSLLVGSPVGNRSEGRERQPRDSGRIRAADRPAVADPTCHQAATVYVAEAIPRIQANTQMSGLYRYRDFHNSRLSNREGGYSTVGVSGHVTNRNIT